MNNKSKKPTDKGGKQSKQKNIQDKDERIKQLEEEVKMLALTIDQVEDEKLEIENKMKKALADYQNLENAIDKRILMKSVQLKKQLGESLITLMDDLKFGIAASENLEISDEVESWLVGLKDTMGKMKNVLGELDITIMDVKEGDDFNSDVHEAIATIPAKIDNTIVEVVQPGYMIEDLVVRPARVVVGRNK